MDKLDHLRNWFLQKKKVAVAFSAGVDSTFLLKAAHDTLGENCIAITCHSSSFPMVEQEAAKEFCEKEGIRQLCFQSREMELPEFTANPPDRCYHCKKYLFSNMKQLTEGYVLVEGSNLDDLGDYRPGLKAIEELGIESPLREVGLTKTQIREYSRQMGLPTWDKPSFACLATRLEVGEEITLQSLRMVEAAEDLLRELGFRQYRVRKHRDLARIELLPEEFSNLMDPKVREVVVRELKALGFRYVSLDLTGYKTGSMNKIPN